MKLPPLALVWFLTSACASGGDRNVCTAPGVQEAEGNGCLYGAREVNGLDGVLILIDEEDVGAFSSAGGHAPAMKDWWELSALPSSCGVAGGLSAAHEIPWASGYIPGDSSLSACAADATIGGVTGTLIVAEDSCVGVTGFWMPDGGATPVALSAQGSDILMGAQTYTVRTSGSMDDCTLSLEGIDFEVRAYPGWYQGDDVGPALLSVVDLEGAGHVFRLGE